TLFIRKVKHDPLDYFQMLGSELFFFDQAFKGELVRDAMKSLGGMGQFNLSRLIRQMADVGHIDEIPKSGMNNDLRFEAEYLIGETLRFILEADGKSILDVEKQIAAIGSREQILNPKILSKRDFLILAARLFAIIASDGHIANDFQTFYSERNAHRRSTVRKWLAALGEIKTPDKAENGVITGFSLPSVLGRLMHRLGIPTGDKTLKGIRLPSFVIDGPLEVQRAYLEEVIPEEGWIRIGKSGDKVEVGIGRAVILFDPKKRSKNPLTRRQANFVKQFGTPRKVVRGDYRHLGIGQLRGLSKRKDKKIARMAHEIEKLIRSIPPTLLMDEKKLMKMNGIDAKDYFEGVRFSEATGRVSAGWTVRSAKKLDVALLGLLAPPNDRKKRSKLLRWMKKNPDIVKKAKLLLEKRKRKKRNA
ncbi:MAG: hypothetical protein ACXABY_20815, partial [Candidatus Thorarchaeota archaeon]